MSIFYSPIELKAIENDTIKIVSWNIKMVPKVLGLLTKSARKKKRKNTKNHPILKQF